MTNEADESDAWPIDAWFSLIDRAQAGDTTAHGLLCKIYLEASDRRKTQRVLLEAYMLRYLWLQLKDH